MPSQSGADGPPFLDDAVAVVLLVDPRELTRHCIERWLGETWPGRLVVPAATVADLPGRDPSSGSVHFGVIAVPAGAASTPETVSSITRLSRMLGDRPVIVLAEDERAEDVGAAIRAGARGYVPASLERAAAVEAIRFVLAGGVFVPAGAITGRQAALDAGPPGRQRHPGRLSPRELEVAAYLRQGKPNKLIAYELAISESTVKVLVCRILAKLGAANRTEAVLLIEHYPLDAAPAAPRIAAPG